MALSGPSPSRKSNSPHLELVEGAPDPRLGSNAEPVGPLTATHIRNLEAEVERLTAGIELIKVDLDNAEMSLRIERRKVTEARNEAAELRRVHEHADDALAVFDYWNRVVKGGRAKSFAGKREKAVITALKTYEVVDLLRAIDGARVDAYKDPKSGKVYDDLELICRDATFIDRFIDAAERHDRRVQDWIERQLEEDTQNGHEA